MKASYHVMVSAGLAAGFQTVTHSWTGAACCFFSGVLIDIDHYLEYYIIEKKFPFRYRDLLDFCEFSKAKKLYLYFHAYEYLVILWLAIWYFQLGPIALGFAVGLSVHLLCDQFTNPIKPLFYFITFRIINRFEKAKFLSDAYYQRQKQ